MARQLSSRDYDGLKAHCRDLVAACGGPARAARITRGCLSRLSEALSPDYPERFMAVDQIADLEAECGRPHVSRHLAEALGFRLVRAEEAIPMGPHQHLARIILECSDVTRHLAEGLEDGTLTEAERQQVAREADEAIAALQDLKAGLRLPKVKVVPL